MNPLAQVLEEVREKTASVVKDAFATNAFSGPMNPVIASGASDQGAAPINSLRSPLIKKSGAWLNHAALNGGQAKRYATDENKEHRSAKEVAKNIGYAILPPHLHHNKEDIAHLREGKPGDWWRAGVDPDAPMPPKPKEKVAFKLQGEMKHQGLDIAIENKPGSVRKGVDKDGKPWRTVMKAPYGYIRGTKGADGEEVDCYVGPVKDSPVAHAVHQKKDDGSYDEDKLILGVNNKEEAKKLYLEHYNTDKYLGPIKQLPMEKLQKLLETGKTLVKISEGRAWPKPF